MLVPIPASIRQHNLKVGTLLSHKLDTHLNPHILLSRISNILCNLLQPSQVCIFEHSISIEQGWKKTWVFLKIVVRFLSFKVLVYKEDRTQNYDSGITSHIHHSAFRIVFYR